jgi:hypothetical protein
MTKDIFDDAVLMDLVMEEGFPSRDVVDAYVVRYPDRVEDIESLVDWHMMDELLQLSRPPVEPNEDDVNRAVDRAMVRFKEELDRTETGLIHV